MLILYYHLKGAIWPNLCRDRH